MAKDWIQTAFALFQQELTDGQVVSRLTSAGCSPAVAEKLVAFIPLACGRALLEGTGVKLSETFRCMGDDKAVGEPESLSSDPHWNVIEKFIAAQKKTKPEAVGLVGVRSAEFDAVNNALLNGSVLADLVGADPIFLFVNPSIPSKTPGAPWWAFWRRKGQ